MIDKIIITLFLFWQLIQLYSIITSCTIARILVLHVHLPTFTSNHKTISFFKKHQRVWFTFFCVTNITLSLTSRSCCSCTCLPAEPSLCLQQRKAADLTPRAAKSSLSAADSCWVEVIESVDTKFTATLLLLTRPVWPVCSWELCCIWHTCPFTPFQSKASAPFLFFCLFLCS